MYEDHNFGPEMTRYRALELAIRNGADPPK